MKQPHMRNFADFELELASRMIADELRAADEAGTLVDLARAGPGAVEQYTARRDVWHLLGDVVKAERDRRVAAACRGAKRR